MGKVASRRLHVPRENTNEVQVIQPGESFDGYDVSDEVIEKYGIDEDDFTVASDGIERDENGAAEGHPTNSPERTTDTVGPDDSGATVDAPHRDAADSVANDPNATIGGKAGGESIVAGHGDGEDSDDEKPSRRSRRSSSDDE